MSVCQHRAGASHTLRFYITPHFAKCQPVTTLKLRFVSATASRPSGLQNRRYVKWLALRGRPAFQPRATVAGYRALPARVFQASRVVCRPFFSVSALRAGGRFAACSPPPPAPCLALRADGPPPVGPSAPPQGGAPTRRRRAFAPCASRTAPLVCRQGSGLRPRHKGAPSCRLSRGRGTGVRFASLPSGAAPPIPRNRQAGRAAPCRRPALFMLAFLSFPLAT